MPKIPAVSARKLIKVLKKDGFILDHIRGSHYIFFHPIKKVVISVPIHSSHDLGKGITSAILKDAKISISDFLRLL